VDEYEQAVITRRSVNRRCCFDIAYVSEAAAIADCLRGRRSRSHSADAKPHKLPPARERPDGTDGE